MFLPFSLDCLQFLYLPFLYSAELFVMLVLDPKMTVFCIWTFNFVSFC